MNINVLQGEIIIHKNGNCSDGFTVYLEQPRQL